MLTKSRLQVSALVASMALLLGGPCMATVTLTGVAAQNLDVAGSNTAVNTGTLFVIVAAPSGSTSFALSGNNTIAASSSLAVGSSLAGDTIIYSGSTTNAFSVQNAAVSASGLDLSSYLGDSFAIVWFPSLTSSNTTVPAGTSYGVATDQSSSEKWVLPSTNAGTFSFGSGQNYTTITAPGQANFVVQSAPEPSRALLAVLGLGMLVVHRRRLKPEAV